ncbi:hypothetical protein QQS21_000834 [Conoideocrella luteorostrata]|uniref:Cell wall protein n=1 Tax=Conoideocrella luteorostrata TaxID=1105319 RepID=A0AAJ0CY72_9HYPO|nr:hypothetical protein QQS21_000834 [Conoideocrella luteorostrata]
MKFLPLATVALSATHAAATLSSKDVTKAIDDITDLSSKTGDIAEGLKSDNIKDDLPKVTNNFEEIVQMTLDNADKLSPDASKSDFKESEQSDICKSFSSFTKEQESLLKTISTKDSILSTNKDTVPLASVLKVFGGIVDKFAAEVFKTAPSCKDQGEKDLKSLDKALDSRVSKLSAILPGGDSSLASGLARIGNDLQQTASDSAKARDKRGQPTSSRVARYAMASSVVTSVKKSPSHTITSGLPNSLPTTLPSDSLTGGAVKVANGIYVRSLNNPTGAAGDITSALGSKTATGPVSRATKPVSKATRPVSRATRLVSRATKPISRATRPVSRATGPVSRATGPVSRATGAAKGTKKGLLRRSPEVTSQGSAASALESNTTASNIESVVGSKSPKSTKPASKPAEMASAQGGASDGSTGGLLGGLIKPGKHGKTKRFHADFVAALKNVATMKPSTNMKDCNSSSAEMSTITR